MSSLFKKNVIEVVSHIKKGDVMTYKEVAEKAGNKNASRAVGNIMAANQDKNIPCHRVVKSDGTIGVYNGLRGESKEKILKKEGVTISKQGKVLLKQVL